MQTPEPIRLNKFLAQQAGFSRRQADEYITNKRIRVNGNHVRLGAIITPQTDVITIDEKPIITQNQTFTYLAFHKPVGYVCSRRQQGSAPTIYSILPEKYHRLKPVGRLDKDSSGIMLLTNDGDLAQQLTHPRYAKTKIYMVELNQPLEPFHQQQISDFGLQLADGRSQLQLQSLNDSRKKWQVTMQEGRNRQIRRTFAALGYDVTALHRIQFGPLQIGKLSPQAYQEIQKP